VSESRKEALKQISTMLKSLSKDVEVGCTKLIKSKVKTLAKSDDEEVKTTNHHGHAEINGKFHSIKEFDDANKYNPDKSTSSEWVGVTHDGVKIKGDDYNHNPKLKGHVKIEDLHPRGSFLSKKHIVGQI
jgi:hypothetical protein